MAIGHKKYEKKSTAELFKILGENDTPKIYAKPVTLNTDYDIPYGGGVSVDGKTVYIDRTLFREVQDGKVCVRGISPKQLIRAWIEHEHTEKSIAEGDNASDAYPPCHEFATAKEERFVTNLLGPGTAERYEDAIAPALDQCAARDPRRPPKDLWCAPYIDDPTPRDKELLRIFRAKGVTDAHKKSKQSCEYGIGAEECKACAHFERPGQELSTCEIVSGLVRDNRWCKWWTERKSK